VSDNYDPGARICGHDHRIHSIGGGIFVCFACWLRAISSSTKAQG
jgi:hypothetical protein